MGEIRKNDTADAPKEVSLPCVACTKIKAGCLPEAANANITDAKEPQNAHTGLKLNASDHKRKRQELFLDGQIVK